MPTRSSIPKDHDFTRTALRVVEQAIGEQWDGSPLPDKDAGKNPAAVTLGRLGGLKGGKARAASMTPERDRAEGRSKAVRHIEPGDGPLERPVIAVKYQLAGVARRKIGGVVDRRGNADGLFWKRCMVM